MATLNEAREALAYLRGRIDAGSMAGERLAVVDNYINGLTAMSPEKLNELRQVIGTNIRNAAPKIIGTSCSVAIVDDVHPTEEETARAHEFFAEVCTVKASDHVKVTFGPVLPHRVTRHD